MSGTVDLSQAISITLPFGAWNTVLALVAKGPWETADPLIQVMRSQIQQASQQNVQRLRPVEEAG